MKKSPKQKAKEKAWKQFSKYIRRRNADKDGYANCVTCGAKKHWKELQAGHFLDGRNNSTLFEETNCHQQCFQCNIYGGHRGIDVKAKYREYMEYKYGKEEIERLVILKPQSSKYTLEEYLDLAEHYADKNVTLDILGIG
jgi:transcription elongation factor Elf1